MDANEFNLDARTFMFFLGIFGISMAFISFSFLRSLPRTILGLREWAIAMIAFGLAFFSFVLRGLAPDFISHFVANAAAVIATAFIILAYMRFFALPHYRV